MEVEDESGGATTVTVTVRVPKNCSSGTAVSNPTSNTGLVSDCKTLLGLKDELAGTGSLNWSGDLAMSDWSGISIGDAPRRVIGVKLKNSSLGGVIPAALGDLAKLQDLWLGGNQLKTTVHNVLLNEAYTGTLVWGTRAKDAAPPVRVEDAHPAIVSKRQFRRVNKLLGSRAPKKVHPRRSASPYLLSGLLRCETCGKAMTAAEAKSGKYTYYVCHSLLKRGSGTCTTPRLNAKSFEKLIVDEIRANVLTESNIRDLVKLLDEEMDGVAAEQRQRLETIEEELEDVKRRLGRIWQVIETTDIEMADASERIKEHRERKEKLEVAAEEARKLLSERRQFLDSADTIATFAAEMSEFLKNSELTETRAFFHSFVKEVEVKPGKAAIVYSIPTPKDSPMERTPQRWP